MNRKLDLSLALAFVVIAVGMTGCEQEEVPGKPETRWVDPKNLRPGPIRHESLTDEQMSRIQQLQQTFSEVDPSPVEKWVEDFKRDANPENELLIWEGMARAFAAFTGSKSLSLEAKKEVFQVVLLRSSAPEEEVLTHLELKTLTEKDAREVMALFTGVPRPIRVVAP